MDSVQLCAESETNITNTSDWLAALGRLRDRVIELSRCIVVTRTFTLGLNAFIAVASL